MKESVSINRQWVIRLLIGALILSLAGNLLPGNIPVLRILITLAVAYIAFRMPDSEESAPRPDAGVAVSTTQSEDGRRRTHSCAFARSFIDLTDSGSLPEQVSINSSFSSTTVRLPVDANITVKSSCAFSGVSVPGRPSMVIGSSTCHLGTQDANAPCLTIRISCAFSSVRLVMG